MALSIHDALTKAETALHDVLDELRRTFGADTTVARAQVSDIIAIAKADATHDIKQAAETAEPTGFITVNAGGAISAADAATAKASAAKAKS